MSDFNVNNSDYKEKAQAQVLTFNNGAAGIVKECKISITRKTSSDSEKAPEYKLNVFDKNQIENKAGLAEDKIYPVNRGFFYLEDFDSKSEAAKGFFVRELRNLLRCTGHPEDEEGNFLIDKKLEGYNDFLDYTMLYVKEAVKKDTSLRFDVVVDYGNENWPKKYLQLNGFPNYICKGDTEVLNLSRDALTERPKTDDEEDTSSKEKATKEANEWLDD